MAKAEKKPTAGSGNFKKLQGSVANEYEKKGKSPEVANKIAGAIAAKVGVAKYGKKAMEKASIAGKKLKASKKA